MKESTDKKMVLKNISGYSALVGAALLLTPTAAEGKLVYVDPVDINVNDENKYAYLDIDGDTNMDFRVSLDTFVTTYFSYYYFYSTLKMRGMQADNMASVYNGFINKNPDMSEKKDNVNWQYDANFLAASATTYAGTVSAGNWLVDNDSKYIRIKFKVSDKTHYGWVRASVKNSMGDMQITIHDWTYEK